jgi:hypothetical protein
VLATVRRAGARFSINVSLNGSVYRVIAAIAPDAWTTIRHPGTVWDEDGQC